MPAPSSVHDSLGRSARSRPCAATSTRGGSKFCGDCPSKLPLKKDEQPAVRLRSTPGRFRRACYIECTAACNISCAQACCAPETGITRTRQAGMLDFELFQRVVDEAGGSLSAHRFLQLRRGVPSQDAAIEMCEYIKSHFPHDLPLHQHQRARR